MMANLTQIITQFLSLRFPGDGAMTYWLGWAGLVEWNLTEINNKCFILNLNVMDVKFTSHNKMLSRYKLR